MAPKPGDKDIPQGWIGQRVILEHTDTPRDRGILITGRLYSVNEFGISYIHEREAPDGTQLYSGPTFYPWGNVRSLSLEEEMDADEYQRFKETSIPR